MTRSARWMVPCMFATALAVAQCAEPETPSQASSPRVGSQLSASRVARAAAAGRLPRRYPRVEWIGEVHASAMEQVVANAWRFRSSNTRARCAFIESVARNSLPRVRQETGVSDPQLYETAIAQAMTRVGCSSAGRLSVFGRPLAFRGALDDTTVTGAYLDYSPQLLAAMDNADSPDDASVGLDVVLNQASVDGLGSGDITVLSGIVSLGKSDAYYWYDIEQIGYSPGDSIPNQFSIFGSYRLCRFWCHLGWADLAGSILGSEVGMTTGPAGALGGAIVGAIVGSAAYWLAS